LKRNSEKKHNPEKIPRKKIHFREDGDHKTQTTKMLKRHNRPQPQCPKHVKATVRMKLDDKLQKVRKSTDNSTSDVSVSVLANRKTAQKQASNKQAKPSKSVSGQESKKSVFTPPRKPIWLQRYKEQHACSSAGACNKPTSASAIEPVAELDQLDKTMPVINPVSKPEAERLRPAMTLSSFYGRKQRDNVYQGHGDITSQCSKYVKRSRQMPARFLE